jgi:hypothetical protein
MQEPCVWMPSRVTKTGRVHAKGLPEPGPGETQETVLSGEPGLPVQELAGISTVNDIIST